MLRSSRNIAAFFVIERVVEDVRCGVNRFSSVFAKTGTFWQDLQSQYVSVLSYVMCLYYVCCVAQSALIFIIIYRQSGAQLKCNYRSITSVKLVAFCIFAYLHIFAQVKLPSNL